MDWITRKTIADNRRGNLKIVLEDVNFADDIEVSHVKCRTPFWGKKLKTPILISEYKDKC